MTAPHRTIAWFWDDRPGGPLEHVAPIDEALAALSQAFSWRWFVTAMTRQQANCPYSVEELRLHLNNAESRGMGVWNGLSGVEGASINIALGGTGLVDRALTLQWHSDRGNLELVVDLVGRVSDLLSAKYARYALMPDLMAANWSGFKAGEVSFCDGPALEVAGARVSPAGRGHVYAFDRSAPGFQESVRHLSLLIQQRFPVRRGKAQ